MLTTVVSAALAWSVAGANAVAQPVTSDWAIALGERVRQTQAAIPVVDQVVLVPDGATYLDEISRWSREGHWPVLFADDHYAQLFMRRFKPAAVHVRESIGAMPADDASRREAVQRALSRSWGDADTEAGLYTAFQQAGHVPPGIVFTAADDSAWTAALALAAGRGQPIGWIDGRYPGPNRHLSVEQADTLLNQINRRMAADPHAFIDLGDALDAITVCRNIAPKVEVQREGNTEMMALTDGLGRRPDGARFAFAGWIFGDETRATYTAMCSLFLDHDTALGVNMYPVSNAPWTQYDLQRLDRALGDGISTVIQREQQAAVNPWLRSIQSGASFDLIFMNTRGGAEYFDTFQGRAFAYDVPVLNQPAAVHFIHSWSFRTPDAHTTIAGQWLHHGAYIYIGSVHEPYLQAFVPPEMVAGRMREGIPMIIAARQWTSPVWKVSTFGDPLMTLAPRRRRVAPADRDAPDLRAQLIERMSQLGDSPQLSALAESVVLAASIGEDAVTVRLWEMLRERDLRAGNNAEDRDEHDDATEPARGAVSRAARAALPAIFATRQHDLFMHAFRTLDERDERAMAMLWHLMAPQASPRDTHDLLDILAANPRRPLSHSDLRRIAPLLAQRDGRQRVRAILESELERSNHGFNQRQLRTLIDEYR